ncbi:MAG TPA: response regulator transcription factor [Drouetiella sp.]
MTFRNAMEKVGSIDIFFVEDNEVIRFCLRNFLKKIPDFSLVGEAQDGEAALDAITQANPTVALVDIGLPGLSGIELTKRLKQRVPGLRVLMLTASDNQNDIFDSLDAGADGYVLKGDFSVNLEMAIRSVKVGAVWLDPGIARQVLEMTQRKLTPTVERALDPVIPQLSKHEEALLNGVAASNCKDGVCLVDPTFLKKLKRFSQTGNHTAIEPPRKSTLSSSEG